MYNSKAFQAEIRQYFDQNKHVKSLDQP